MALIYHIMKGERKGIRKFNISYGADSRTWTGTLGLEDQDTNQLYNICILERIEGIEPSTKPWQSFVLPLNYIRILVRVVGFEPTRA